MRLTLGVLLAFGLFVAAIVLPDPAAAAVGGDAPDNAAVDAVIPEGRVTPLCRITPEWVIGRARKAAEEQGWAVAYWLAVEGVKTTLTFEVIGSPGLLEYTFLDGCYLRDRLIPP